MISTRDYDVVVVNSSSGKDSQTLLDEVCTQAQADNTLDRVIVAHADLGRIEWPGAAELAEKQASMYGVRFWKMTRSNGDLLDYALRRGRWPSPKQRWCTSDLKRDQINKLFTQVSRSFQSKHLRILNCLGMRAEESPARSKLPVQRKNTRASTKTREVTDYHGIHSWKVGDVWSSIKASGVPHHVAYDYGMPRLSCCFCIYAPKPALVIAAKHNPDLLRAYVEAERRMNHRFRVDVSMAEVEDELKMLGRTSVTVPDWKM